MFARPSCFERRVVSESTTAGCPHVHLICFDREHEHVATLGNDVVGNEGPLIKSVGDIDRFAIRGAGEANGFVEAGKGVLAGEFPLRAGLGAEDVVCKKYDEPYCAM